jgi:hypothetical protein
VAVAFALLDAIPTDPLKLMWNLAVLPGLALPLGPLGLVEARGGTRNIPVPELLRIDRISLADVSGSRERWPSTRLAAR